MHGSFTFSVTRLITLCILMLTDLITCLTWHPCLTTSHDPAILQSQSIHVSMCLLCVSVFTCDLIGCIG
ncbi:hypothetical protein BC830DRAFT_1124381 [Chytriomyces sp. MP71]|nr:hypothetical protein BC830DRAFT_1124381 [Chytriomyces sp. MP71]